MRLIMRPVSSDTPLFPFSPRPTYVQRIHHHIPSAGRLLGACKPKQAIFNFAINPSPARLLGTSSFLYVPRIFVFSRFSDHNPTLSVSPCAGHEISKTVSPISRPSHTETELGGPNCYSPFRHFSGSLPSKPLCLRKRKRHGAFKACDAASPAMGTVGLIQVNCAQLAASGTTFSDNVKAWFHGASGLLPVEGGW